MHLWQAKVDVKDHQNTTTVHGEYVMAIKKLHVFGMYENRMIYQQTMHGFLMVISGWDTGEVENIIPF